MTSAPIQVTCSFPKDSKGEPLSDFGWGILAPPHGIGSGGISQECTDAEFQKTLKLTDKISTILHQSFYEANASNNLWGVHLQVTIGSGKINFKQLASIATEAMLSFSKEDVMGDKSPKKDKKTLKKSKNQKKAEERERRQKEQGHP